MKDVTDPQVLLRWMRNRGGDIPARAISDAAPRPFRRRAEADVALAALIEAGEIVAVSARPRSFRVLAQNAPKSGSAFGPDQRSLVSQFANKFSCLGIRDLLDVAVAQHRHAGRSEAASLVLGAADVRDGMRRDPRRAPEPDAYGRCQHCGEDIDGPYASLLHGVRVHVGCVLRYRNAVDRRIDEAIVAALEECL